MSKLFSFFRNLFQGQLSWFASIFEENIALRLAWITFAISLLVVMYATVNGILAGISYAMPSWITTPASWIVPSNLSACITAYFGAYVAVYIFEWKMFISSKYMG